MPRPPGPRSTTARAVVVVAIVVVVVVALAGVAGCAREDTARPVVPGTPATLPPSTATPTEAAPLPPVPAPAPLQWVACGPGVSCASLTVPLDYGDPAGPTVELAVTRHAAQRSDRLGALVVNPGGPGASGTQMARASLFGGELGERFDVIGLDPRGVGDSVPVACGSDSNAYRALDPSPDDDAERAALDDAATAIAAACGQAAAPLLAHLDSVTTARDIDQLRRALGEEQISYLGVSYGTLLGQEYARLFPDRVRAMVLDGVTDPAKPLTEVLIDQAVAGERVLADVLPAYDRVAAQVERQALPSRSGATVGPGLLGVAAFSATYGTGGAAAMADALAQAEAGDGTALATLAQAYLDAGVNFDTYLAISCVDSPKPTGLGAWSAFVAQAAAAAPRLGPTAANELRPCATWPAAPVRQPSPIAPAGLVAVLVVSTTDDVATPIEDARQVAANLPGAVLLTVDGDGHGATVLSACARGAAVRYLVDLELPPAGAVCES